VLFSTKPFLLGYDLLNIREYKTIVFDCDGVILDSNIVKTQAYFRTAKQLGVTDAQAQALVDYHVKLGGVSRYHKFDWLLREVLKQPVTKAAIQIWLDAFAKELEVVLMQCAIAEGLEALKQLTPNATWMVLSGGDQQEIRDLFHKRTLPSGKVLAELFEGGLFGSPDNKDEVLAREKASVHLQFPALFIGDSKYDYEAANKAGLDFVFLSDWTEVDDWKGFCMQHRIQIKKNIRDVMSTQHV
jgi:phosphoglycolate phosphatase-like HAD superfamily hydrolase